MVLTDKMLLKSVIINNQGEKDAYSLHALVIEVLSKCPHRLTLLKAQKLVCKYTQCIDNDEGIFCVDVSKKNDKKNRNKIYRLYVKFMKVDAYKESEQEPEQNQEQEPEPEQEQKSEDDSFSKRIITNMKCTNDDDETDSFSKRIMMNMKCTTNNNDNDDEIIEEPDLDPEILNHPVNTCNPYMPDNCDEDDELTEEQKDSKYNYRKLLKIKTPEQRSPEWFAMRNGSITASAVSSLTGNSKYNFLYEFILHKVFGDKFSTNDACYHGKKFEAIATMIYERRLDVTVKEFGLILHPKYKFLGASPDGVISETKLNGKAKTKYVGRGLEIKCPTTRKIITTGEIIDNICPIYYWEQVQLQGTCCNIKEIDFFQCILREYENRQEFEDDTDPNVPFFSKEFGFEKGVLIQVIPKDHKDKMAELGRDNYIYEYSKHIYMPRLNMSPEECNQWIKDTIKNLPEVLKTAPYNTGIGPDFVYDKTVYWRLEKSICTTIKTDPEWFKKYLPEFKKGWAYVEHFRKNLDKGKILHKYVKSYDIYNNPKKNPYQHKPFAKKMMEYIDTVYNEPDSSDKSAVRLYNKTLEYLQRESEKENKWTTGGYGYKRY